MFDKPGFASGPYQKGLFGIFFQILCRLLWPIQVNHHHSNKIISFSERNGAARSSLTWMDFFWGNFWTF